MMDSSLSDIRSWGRSRKNYRFQTRWYTLASLATSLMLVSKLALAQSDTITLDENELPPDVANFFSNRSPTTKFPSNTARVVEAIEVTGNRRTKKSVILAQLSLRVGELVDETLINASQIRLLSMGFFQSVRFSLRRGSARGLVLLVVEVEEKNTLRVENLNLGVNSLSAPFVALGLSETNFLGRGVTVGGSGALGFSEKKPPSPAEEQNDNSTTRRALEFHIFVPYLSGTNLQLSASIAFIEGIEVIDPSILSSPMLNYERTGGTLGLGFSSGPAQRISLLYRLEALNADRAPNAISPASLRRAPSILSDRSALSSLELAWERDTRDDAFAPSRGVRLALAVEMGSSIIGSNYEFSKYTGEVEYAVGASSKQQLVLKAFGGIIQGETPFFNQFFLRDYTSFSYDTPALPRILQLNFSRANDYDDLLLNIGIEYSYSAYENINQWLSRFIFYVSSDFAITSSLEEAQDDIGGRDAFDTFPLYIDAGVKLDTSYGRFTLSLAYITDMALDLAQ